MLHLRELCWPADREHLLALDTSFTTDRVYRVVATNGAFALEECAITPSLHKTYDLTDELDALIQNHHVVIAEVDGDVVGMAALKYEAWNRRAVLWHLYIDPKHRGRGIARALIKNAIQVARNWQARCLWLETQNVNYPAIQCYRRLGFELCGLDLTLYDTADLGADEVALFFAYTI